MLKPYKAMADESGNVWVVMENGDTWTTAPGGDGHLYLRRKFVEGEPPEAPQQVKDWRVEADIVMNRQIAQEYQTAAAARKKLTLKERAALGIE